MAYWTTYKILLNQWKKLVNKYLGNQIKKQKKNIKKFWKIKQCEMYYNLFKSWVKIRKSQ